MKQGLSLRVSQHLALTPQLQQSIRLLQLSTLELSQEVEQMLDDNPFLELNAEEAPREEFGLPQVDTPVRRDDLEAESASSSIASNDQATLASDQNESEVAVPESWEGDGTTEVLPDDSEWGGDAPARKNNLGDDDERADRDDIEARAYTSDAKLDPKACAGPTADCIAFGADLVLLVSPNAALPGPSKAREALLAAGITTIAAFHAVTVPPTWEGRDLRGDSSAPAAALARWVGERDHCASS